MAQAISKFVSTAWADPVLVQLAAFKTKIGWFGVVHVGPVLFGLKFGFATRRELVSQFTDSLDRSGRSEWVSPRIETAFDGFSKSKEAWQQLLVDYSAGKKVSFSRVELNDSGRTKFQSSVLRACRQIPYGSTLSYGALAAKSGSPNAARAVGSTMKSNRFPIIIPCHRVVASTGVGGFSGVGGTSTKRRLLGIEGYFDDSLLPDLAERR